MNVTSAIDIPIKFLDSDDSVASYHTTPDLTKITGDVYSYWSYNDDENPILFKNAINAGFTKFQTDGHDFVWFLSMLMKYHEYITEIIIGWTLDKYQTDILKCDWNLVHGINLLEKFMTCNDTFEKSCDGYYNDDYSVTDFGNFIELSTKDCYDGNCLVFGLYYLEENLKLISGKIGVDNSS